jgi:NADP-dependent 3-hydroxy acid dehydrogenase YdfG
MRDRPCRGKTLCRVGDEALPRRSARQEALDRAAEQLSGATLVTVPTDVSRMEDVECLKDRAYEAFGEVGVMMNNAGTSPGGGAWDNYERWL